MTGFNRIIPSVVVAVVVAFAMAGCSGPAGMSTTSPTAPEAALQDTAKTAGGSSASAGIASHGTSLVSPSAGQHMELKGVVESITPPTLAVSGRKVVTNASTRFKGSLHSLADLRVRDSVKVEATVQRDGSLLAREIKRVGAAGNAGQGEVELKGAIESITPPSLRVAAQTVLVDQDTRIERDDHSAGLADLKVGETAEVKGVRLADGNVLARKIEVGLGNDENDGDNNDGEHEDGDHDDGNHDDGDHDNNDDGGNEG